MYEKKNYLDLTIIISVLSGVLVVYGTEFIFIVDSFNNRMNTIFKFYFFVYLLISIFSIVVTILASLFPSLAVTKVESIKALKYE